MAEGLYRIGGWLLDALEILFNEVMNRCSWDGIEIKLGFLDGVNSRHFVASYLSPSRKSLVHVPGHIPGLGQLKTILHPPHNLYNVVWKHNYQFCLVEKSDLAQIYPAGSFTRELLLQPQLYLLVEVINSKFCLENF